MKRMLILLVACLALVAAGCGGDDDEETTTSRGPTTTEESSSAAGGAIEIKMKDIQFAPDKASVKAGQTVKWVNEDSVEHDVSADNGEFKSERFGQGGEFETKLDKAGSVPYVCTVHPNMKATLTVTE
jgi:plastocyanin